MANLRTLKKDIDYLVEEVLTDSYLTLHFHPEKREQVVAVMRKAVDVRNDLFAAVNNPPEKNNRSLVKKHYNHIRRDMFTKVDGLFGELSTIVK